MNIQPTYLTFEQAKLLKKKGFDSKYITATWNINEQKMYPKYSHGLVKESKHLIIAPEQWQVIEWFELKYQKYIYAFRYNGIWQYKIDAEHGTDYFSTGKGYSSKQEAYLAAFDYILKELI
jgi:hypothetical protein